MGKQVISADVSHVMRDLFRLNVLRGSGRRADVPGYLVGGKTGTTNENTNAWFIGFTADYVAGVWMGYDDNTPLTGVTGGGLPAEIWRETMVRVHEGLPASPLPMAEPAMVTRRIGRRPILSDRRPQIGAKISCASE